MPNQKQLDRLLKQGVDGWNKWRVENSGVRIDLIDADLSRAALDGVYLGLADLSGAILTDATINYADLGGATLSGATLDGVHLGGAILADADLTDASLIETSLIETSLSNANLSGAHLWSTVFGNVDLSTVKELETVYHRGPSIIGIDTIIRSQGNIPEIFLRNAGVPDSIIEAIPSLIGSLNPIDFYSCFISYSSKDQAFAERLHADLQNKGVRCWFVHLSTCGFVYLWVEECGFTGKLVYDLIGV